MLVRSHKPVKPMTYKNQMSKSDDKPDVQALKSRQRVIGARLQAVYEDVVRQGVPDDLQQLLARLDDLDDQPSGDDEPSDGRDG